MYLHFQQDFLVTNEFTITLFDLEPAGDLLNHHLNFEGAGRQYHLMMSRNEDGDRDMVDKKEQRRLEGYKQQFGYAIKHKNLQLITYKRKQSTIFDALLFESEPFNPNHVTHRAYD